jgi:signal transduction histidine kinase
MTRRLAPAFLALAFGLLGGWAVLWLLDPIPMTSNDASSVITEICVAIGYSTVGAFVASRRPANRVGWLLLVIGLGMSGFLLGDEYAIRSLLVRPGSLPGGVFVAWADRGLWALVWFAVLPLTVTLFPTGRPISRFWWGAWAPLAAGLVLSFGAFFTPGPLTAAIRSSVDLHVKNPIGMPILMPLHLLQTPLFVAPFVLAGVAVVSRWRRAREDERQQLKWLAAAAALIPVFIVAVLFLQHRPGPTWSAGVNLVVGALVFAPIWLGVPVAIGVAILRYRLYDIDVVINRTLVFGTLAAFITAVYVGIVVGIGTLVGSQGDSNLALSIAATAVVALAFQPVRERIERLANRLVYGQRATPYEVLAQFSHRVAGAYANEEVLLRLALVLGEGTGAVSASVWVRGDGQHTAAATWPPEAQPVHLDAADRTVPVRHQGEDLGQLAVKKRAGEPLNPVEEKLLADLAAQAGQVLRNVRLTADLQARLEQISTQAADLRESRQRIVAAQDAERRRLERNIHDGAQQHLVALAVKLRLTATLARRDPERARPSIDDLRRQTRDALATLSALAAGLYPAVLRERGIAAALSAQTSLTTVPVEVVDHLNYRYSEDLEAAVYFCCQEAIQNAVKHAHASHISVRIDDRDGTLRFTVSDDGTGFDASTARRGAGMQNMADRIAAGGGALEVDSRRGGGTTVQGYVGLLQKSPGNRQFVGGENRL